MNHLKTFRAGLTAALLLLLSFVQVAKAQTHTPKYNVSMTPNSGGYYEYLPEGYNPSGTTKHPLIIFIHGVYEKGNGGTSDLPDIVKFGLPKKIKYGSFPKSFTVNGKTEKFIVISPQFKSSPSSFDINAVLTYVLNKYKVNPNKVYLTGLSMGGGAVWNFGSNTLYNNRLAAMVPICGSVSYTTEKAGNIARAGIKVWATHNQSDRDVSSSKTVNWVNKINAANPPTKAKMSIWARSGHDAWSRTYDASYKEDGKNIFEWMLQFEKGSTPPVTNKPPVANAGTDKGVTLPTSSVTLTGTGTDPDGSISKYSWTKVSGPTGGAISSASAATTTVSALLAGTYTFRLTVTDNSGVSASNDVNVIVGNPSNPLTNNNNPAKLYIVNVNISGSSNSYANAAWNNWNVSSSLSSGTLRYADATTSTISAALSKNEGINDNGSGYGSGIAPAEVLRYTSNATSSRTLTISGLSASKTYALEIYGSRNNYSGNTTRYTIGSSTKNIATYKNLTNKAQFPSLVPNTSGQIVVTITNRQVACGKVGLHGA